MWLEPGATETSTEGVEKHVSTLRASALAVQEQFCFVCHFQTRGIGDLSGDEMAESMSWRWKRSMSDELAASARSHKTRTTSIGRRRENEREVDERVVRGGANGEQ